MWWRSQFQTLFSKIEIKQSPDQQSKVFYSLFLLYAELRTIKTIETKQETLCFYILSTFFKKLREVWN